MRPFLYARMGVRCSERPLIEIAPAKVNLYLRVVGRRADGYHLLDSLAVFPGAADQLSAVPSAELSLEITGPFAQHLVAAPDNLVLRAARGLAALAGSAAMGSRLTLQKHLPVASGIGGGSADAAAALRLLSHLWGLRPDPAALANLALSLGADIPVCLASLPQRMQGVGEILLPAPLLPPYAIVLLNPGVSVATADVFRARQGPWSPPANLPGAWATAASMASDLAALDNDLEAAAMALCPPIVEARAALQAQPGCLLARMSGSGATCFGLFSDASAAATAAARLERPGWWCWSHAVTSAAGAV